MTITTSSSKVEQGLMWNTVRDTLAFSHSHGLDPLKHAEMPKVREFEITRTQDLAVFAF